MCRLSEIDLATTKATMSTTTTPPQQDHDGNNSSTHTNFTLQDVTANNTPKSAYALYKNRVLDITSFARRHPGGDIILLAAGKDATVLVETYHPKGVPMKVIEKLTIGTINPKEIPPSYYSWSSPFYNTLRERVVQRLESLNKPLRGTFQIQFKSVLLLVGFWYSLYQMYTSPFRSALIWTVVMGVFAHFIGTCIQHDGNHGAYSVNKYLNVFAGWTMDMIGASAFTWQFQHMLGHHPYTNLLTESPHEPDLVESDPDVFSSYPLMRMHPLHDTTWYHAYQHIYAPFLFAGMTLAKVFTQDWEILLSKKLYHIDAKCRYDDINNVIRFLFMKALSSFYMMALPIYFHGIKGGLALFVLGHMTCGEVLATMFIVNHVIDGVAFANVDQMKTMETCDTDDSSTDASSTDVSSTDANDNSNNTSDEDDFAYTHRPKTTQGINPMETSQKQIKSSDRKVPYNDWAAVQCQTSVNWSKGSWFWNHMSGGLNHQIEHHLFPSICHTNYVYIQDVVEDTCREFGVPYQSEDNLWVAYGKMLKHLKIMGNAEDLKKCV